MQDKINGLYFLSVVCLQICWKSNKKGYMAYIFFHVHKVSEQRLTQWLCMLINTEVFLQ